MLEFIEFYDYKESKIVLYDHLGGFDKEYFNAKLYGLDRDVAAFRNKKLQVKFHQILPSVVNKKYPNLNFIFDSKKQVDFHLRYFEFRRTSFDKNFKHFISCFNGSFHLSRMLLTSILSKRELWQDDTCSKNFGFDQKTLLQTISKYVESQKTKEVSNNFLNKNTFYGKIIKHGYQNSKVIDNFYHLQDKINSAFLNITAESVAESYIPYITEKFLLNVITKNLFLSYGQPLWHQIVEKYYGFKMYAKIFDYSFDDITNPVFRLISLINSIEKFKNLSTLDWHDLYTIEKDTLDYNYDHYFSGNYITFLENSYTTHNNEILDNLMLTTYNYEKELTHGQTV